MKNDNAEDNRLIRASRRGDCEAFQQLFEKYSGRVYAIAFTYTRSRDDGLDIVQDVFLSMYKNLHRFRAGSDFFPWLRRMTVNRCIDRLRAKRRRPRNAPLLPEGANLARSSEDADPARQAQVHELEDLLEESVEKLSEKHREVLKLYSVEQLGYREIADIMKCSIGTVMSRLHYARKQLGRFLEPYGASTA
jgi:RNA polymerase sigma-70 factor (ECF subfamily)